MGVHVPTVELLNGITKIDLNFRSNLNTHKPRRFEKTRFYLHDGSWGDGRNAAWYPRRRPRDFT